MRMDLAALEQRLARGDVGTVVATLGTTGTGAVDPLPGILKLKERFPFRLHVDAAYGGYYKLVPDLAGDARRGFEVIDEADSIVVDPHKHGLQPYGCGCVLFKDPTVGQLYRHDSPYTYFSSDDLHLGEISLECSRAGAAAVALWATQELLPLVPGGAFATALAKCRAAAQWLYAKLDEDPRFLTLFPPGARHCRVGSAGPHCFRDQSASAKEFRRRGAPRPAPCADGTARVAAHTALAAGIV